MLGPNLATCQLAAWDENAVELELKLSDENGRRKQTKWIAPAESRSVRGASHQPIFMGDCPTICHTYLPCLPW